MRSGPLLPKPGYGKKVFAYRVVLNKLFLCLRLRLSVISQLVIPMFTIFSNLINGNSSD